MARHGNKHGGKGPRVARKRQGSGGHTGGEMVKHRGFPSRMSGTDFQFTIRRAGKEGASPLVRRERFADRRAVDREADRQFLAALWDYFGEEEFVRGNLDAGRLSWLFGREVVAVEDPFDPQSYESLLQIDRSVAEVSFPELFNAGGEAWVPQDWDDFEDLDDFDEDEGEESA